MSFFFARGGTRGAAGDLSGRNNRWLWKGNRNCGNSHLDVKSIWRSGSTSSATLVLYRMHDLLLSDENPASVPTPCWWPMGNGQQLTSWKLCPPHFFIHATIFWPNWSPRWKNRLSLIFLQNIAPEASTKYPKVRAHTDNSLFLSLLAAGKKSFRT